MSSIGTIFFHSVLCKPSEAMMTTSNLSIVSLEEEKKMLFPYIHPLWEGILQMIILF